MRAPWRGSRPPQVRLGRPYVLRRQGRWLVLTVEHGAIAVVCCLPHAHDYARSWAVFHHGLRPAAREADR